jgi:hypothetical protein
MKAPTGAVVGLYYDSPRSIQEGDVLETPGGRCYLLVGVRRQTKGMHVGRWHLKAVVVESAPEGAKVHPIYWYPRKAKRRPVRF